MDKNIFYNYDRVISYNAFLNFLIGERGVGKDIKQISKKEKRNFLNL